MMRSLIVSMTLALASASMEIGGAAQPQVVASVGNDGAWDIHVKVTPPGYGHHIGGRSFPAARMPKALPGTHLPPVDAAHVMSKVLYHFPGALSEQEFVDRVQEVLANHCGTQFGPKTLVATSLCCDEVNRGLEEKLSDSFGGSTFSMGGLAGFPFCGITSFGAFAHHIPTPGSALVCFGPHVGVDSSGVVGKVDRRGMPGSGACCGSAAAALGAFKGGNKAEGDGLPKNYMENLDVQQSWVSASLLDEGRGERVVSASNEMAELPRALFDAQKKAMMGIIEAAAPGNVPAGTTVALVGGVQINTPAGVSDYFLPLVFELRNADGKVEKNLLTEL